MVNAPTCVRKRTMDYSCKYRNLDKFSTDVEHFLEEYGSTAQHSAAYHRSFRRNLKHLQDAIEVLLDKLQTIRIKGLREQLFMEKFCCGVLFNDCDEAREHYFRFHNAPRLVHPCIVEFDSGHGKLKFFQRRVEEYTRHGTEATSVLLVNLKKLLRNIANTLDQCPVW